jgi:hypothetical protein
MSQWERDLKRAEHIARTRVIDWSRIDASISAGLALSARRKRRKRIAGAVASIGVAAATATAATLLVNTERAPIEPISRFDKQSAQRLMEVCGTALPSGRATEEVVAVNRTGYLAAALVRDETSALLCDSTDPTLQRLSTRGVAFNDRPAAKTSRDIWTVVRAPNELVYVGAAMASESQGAWASVNPGVGFGLNRLKSNVQDDETIHLIVMDIPRGLPPDPDAGLVVGLYDSKGCECGPIHEIRDRDLAQELN